MMRMIFPALFAFVALTFLSQLALSNDPLSKKVSWKSPTNAEIVESIRSSLDRTGVAAQKVDAVVDLWSTWVEAEDMDPLTAFVRAVATVVPDVDKIYKAAEVSSTEAISIIESSGWLSAASDSMPVAITASVRTWLARELVRDRLYDEALPIFDSVEPSNCVDPASVMFYRAVCHHSLLMKQESLADLRRLLENESDSPVRFVRTAHLMVADIKPLKEDSLDEISRLMTDVTRRLDLGRATEDVRKREQSIIDKLTKLIEKMEKQQQ